MMPKGRPFGTPQPCGNEGGLEEHNRRTLAQMANEQFVMALYHARMAEVDLANKIERELNGGISNEDRADLIEAEYVSPHDRAMQRIRDGAQIVEIIPFSKRGHEMTLAGNSSSWMG